jgi:UDP-N-acetyl-D-glucosamine/UDP-N-acetyl-D-galactosamine dehydrogenase
MKKIKIGVIGLGYVGLPLAVCLSKKFEVKGFDINKNRIDNLCKGYDQTLEFSKKELNKIKNNISFINSTKLLDNCNFFIIAVPTPIYKNKNPDLRNLKKATEIVGKILKPDSIVVFESTVYPGVTENVCVPILEKFSKLEYKKDFNCGYSPERINPGDKKRKIQNIVKVVSGSSTSALKKINYVYKKSIRAGTFIAGSIKVAEAAKVIENSQRDINIAFINELSKIFDKLEINTYDVLKAANTKWNFLDFKPGLVGGHCIGVDPYYLASIAKQNEYNPKIILSGRNLNNEMSSFVVSKLWNYFKNKTKKNLKSVLILGLTFKEDCNDYRNSLIFDIIKIIKKKKINYEIFDPFLLHESEQLKMNGIKIKKKIPKKKFDAVLVAVGHNYFKKMGLKKITRFSKYNIIFDLKNIFNNKNTLTL